jgi:hypothetical protein
MKTTVKVILLSLVGFYSSLAAQTQQELDTACESARENRLAPLRQQFIDECVQKQKKDLEHCTRFYSDYGAKTGNRAALFYDLPECVRAFENRKSSSRKQ